MLDYRSIMSGRRRDPLAILLRGVSYVGSLLYGSLVKLRNARYEGGKAKTIEVAVPVISVGNLTTGGTGKTPIVCFLANWFCNRGVKVAIVSRGYRRGDREQNDEAMELAARLPNVPHVQNPDRVEAARTATIEHGAQLVLMDDGFQHRRLHRDLNIIVIDATCPFGFGYLLPRGLLREPISGLNRADLVIITRCDAVHHDAIESIRQTIHRVCPELRVLQSVHRPAHLLEFPDRLSPIEALRGQRVAVVSAIGNPHAFEQTVQACGANIVDTMHLPDHDNYSPQTVEKISSWIQSLGDQVQRVVCTHKDLVKLQRNQLANKPIAAIQIELEFQKDTDALEARLESVLR